MEMEVPSLTSKVSKPLWQRLYEDIGLSEYEARAYISLLENGPSTASRLSMISGIPRTKIYGTLKKLIERGLVVEVPENPRMFISAPPSEALEPILRAYERLVEGFQTFISSLEEMYIKTNYTSKLRRSNLWVVLGRNEILQKVSRMLTRANKIVELVTTEDGLVLIHKFYGRVLDDLAGKGVEVRIFTQRSSRNQSLIRELCYVYKVRQLDVPPSILYVNVDDSRFLLASLTGDASKRRNSDIGVFMENPILCNLIFRLLRIGRPREPVIVG
ncbi:MAG: TrmB family transcriptional regulator [Candidatus Bathyarchaeota archaeon B26-2]|nr:MAG: TrmB family transcriptional regulator [Candidatus Bathyarchaeota archaeon B26-2]